MRQQMNTPKTSNRHFSAKNYSHWPWLLYWPLYGLMFIFVERFYPVEEYHVIHCALDDLIPFHELFLLPYCLWFILLVTLQSYTFFREPAAFRRMTAFIALTFTAAILFYMIYPNCQQLRPQVFERDNPLTRVAALLYRVDTSTNVCPSIHVIGSFAVLFASFDCKRLSTFGWRIFFWASTVLISVSTVALKQHSVVDIVAAIPVSVLGYWLVYRLPERLKKSRLSM